jgi:uncharacterized protein YbjT (DUF2867 family)
MRAMFALLGLECSAGASRRPRTRRRRDSVARATSPDHASESSLLAGDVGSARVANVFVTGGTGYMGSRLVPRLLERGHSVRALVRGPSASRLPAGCEPVVGDALDARSFASRVPPSDTIVHLVGVAHPSPAKAKEFVDVDLASIRATVAAAREAGCVRHVVYLSVAQPAPAMRSYVAVRAQGEAMLRESGIPSTFVRPWYVLGPGHRWPYLLLPLYAAAELLPWTRETARRLRPVKLPQVLGALVDAVENPPRDVRVIDTDELRART